MQIHLRRPLLLQIAASPTLRLFMMLASSLHQVNAATKSTPKGKSPPLIDLAQERTDNLQFVLSEFNHLARLPEVQRSIGQSLSSSSTNVASAVPLFHYTIHSVFSDVSNEISADLIQYVPVYRTVRGYDEKRRRPVLYQTLVQEERYVKTVIDRSTTYHLVLEKHVGDLHQQEVEETTLKLHQRKKECDAADDAICPTRTQPLPQELLHVLVTVSIDKDGSRAITMLRGANSLELEEWWAKFIIDQHETVDQDDDRKTTTSSHYAALEEGHRQNLMRSFIPLPQLFALGGLTASIPRSSSSTTGPLTVMSVNIWNYNYWTRRLSLLASVIRAESPDLIGFQEVRAVKSGPGTGQGRWQVSDLAKMLPEYEYAYRPAMGFHQDADFVHEGLAIFSRYPIERVDVLPLSRDAHDGQDFHQRICLRARVRTPAGKVNILTTHLSLSQAARERTLPEVSRFASSFLPEPTILVGDFNSVFTEGPKLLLAPEHGAFKDTWSELNGDTPESDQRGWTFHAWDHRSRIDFIFYRSTPETTVPTLHIADIRVVGREGESLHGEPLPPIGGVADMKDTMFPSDHMFLVAQFTMDSEDRTAHTTSTTTTPSTTSSSSIVMKGDSDHPTPLSASVMSMKDEL